MTQPATISLNDQIAEAKDSSEVQTLLAKGREYERVSNRTLNRWKRTAARRIKELNGDATIKK